jgi:chorismate--pyruvate lyase
VTLPHPLQHPQRMPQDLCWQLAPCAAGRYRPWLTDRGSLTERITARSPGMTVKVIFQGRRRLHRDELFLARRGASVMAYTRDVVLYCGAMPVVYAHSVLMPGRNGPGLRLMRGLGSMPLGAALFTDPRIRRLKLRQQKLAPGHELARQARQATRNEALGLLWARRSLFITGKSPILVTEVFLPGVLTL